MSGKFNTSQRLHEALGKLIAGMQAGDRLPAEPTLARQLGVSRATLREAMRTFETQGLIHRRQGSGTYVTRPSRVMDSGLEVLESIDTLAGRINLPVTAGERWIASRRAAPNEAQVLGIALDSQVLVVSRVILAEGHAAAYLIDILPEDILSAEDLGDPFTGSVLDVLLRRQSLALTSSRCQITAITASTEVARAMGIQRGDVLLCFEAYLYASDGRVVDYSFSYFLPGYFRFHVVRRVEQNFTSEP